jgi:pre-rRNA-processing protein TSR3
MPAIRLFALMEHEDDPKRCTAAKLVRFKQVQEVKVESKVPRGAIVLDPEAQKAVSREDAGSMVRHGLLVLDCSWNKLAKFPKIRRGLEHRALPFMLAANPTNFGKAQRLSSAEALAASLYIIGEREQAKRLMSLFKWGPVFLDINRERLEEYASAATSAEVVAAQDRMLHAMARTKDDIPTSF